MPLSRLEIKKRMVELARKYVETHDKENHRRALPIGRHGKSTAQIFWLHAADDQPTV